MRLPPPPLPAYLQGLADPFLLRGMDAAVERLLQAREKQERIAVFGDYDVDGVTSTAILLELLRTLGWNAASYLPHRLDEGYGLSLEAVQNCLERCAPNLLVAVDCGSASVASVDYLNHMVGDHPRITIKYRLRRAATALINRNATHQTGSSNGDSRFKEPCSAGSF
jgi:single-stranded-DNA-specific exonuclease